MASWTSRGVVVGGAVAAAISIPEALALGAIAFAPLGARGAAVGALAGLMTLVVHNLVSALFRGVRPMTAGAYSLTSLMIAATVSASGHEGDDAMAAIVGISVSAGLFQTLFGVLRLGNLGKYIPYPVVSGLVNGTALLLLIVYLPRMIGGEGLRSLLEPASWHMGHIGVGLTVLVVSLLVERRWARVPGPVFGLLAGVLVFWGGRMMDLDVGALIAETADGRPGVALLGALADPVSFLQAAFELAPFGLGVGAVASLRTLIVTVTVDREVDAPATASRELMAHGVANLFTSLVGGVPAAAYGSASMAAIQVGARTRAVRLWCGVFAAVALLLINPVTRALPVVALSAMLVAYAFRTLDPWSVTLLRRVLRRPGELRFASADVVTVLAVTAILVGWGIFEAVVVGVGIALASFVVRMSRPPLRRAYTAERVRSYVERPAGEIAALESLGADIAVFELQGALFFGAADHVAARVSASLESGARAVLIDLERVNDLDSTGAHVALRVARACKAADARLYLSTLPSRRVRAPLTNAGVLDEAEVHETLDAALAAAEDRLLDEKLGAARYDDDIPLAEVDALRFLDAPESILDFAEVFAPEADHRLFSQGDAGDSLYVVLRGRVHLDVDVGDGPKRLALLCPGTVLGEMALLDGRPRAATATAERRVHCLRISADDFARMRAEAPDVATCLMEGLAAELAKRVRIANRHATELRA
jgi:SulP family sulfate permease